MSRGVTPRTAPALRGPPRRPAPSHRGWPARRRAGAASPAATHRGCRAGCCRAEERLRGRAPRGALEASRGQHRADPRTGGFTAVAVDGRSLGRSRRDLEREVDRFDAAPIDDPEVHTRRDLTDLVADAARKERTPGVVQDDRLAAVEPARSPIDLGSERLDPERRDLIHQFALTHVEDLALPGQPA